MIETVRDVLTVLKYMLTKKYLINYFMTLLQSVAVIGDI